MRAAANAGSFLRLLGVRGRAIDPPSGVIVRRIDLRGAAWVVRCAAARRGSLESALSVLSVALSSKLVNVRSVFAKLRARDADLASGIPPGDPQSTGRSGRPPQRAREFTCGRPGAKSEL